MNKYYCPWPECDGELEEIQIGTGGDETVPGVMCYKCSFYKSITDYQEYIDDDKEIYNDRR